ncbi:hypothetical protein EYF80_046801 [Liparis tanakae]|uniref:Uncharacterized protein n=1 Tax=Liparis tanakae TaxID=230148 RepID=A0A4Z2FQL1_9TELE|nr:hypothetical protein EYF80_046801 [Liparis tanakae]
MKLMKTGGDGERTAQMSSIQNVALQVGQGTLLDNQVSGLCWSWRLANHRPRQDRHHMGLQKHCWHSDSLPAPMNTQQKSSLMVWWITTLGEFLMGALSLSLSSAYSVEMSLETEGQTHVICCGFLGARDHTERRMHKHLISKGLTAGLMLSTLRVKICAGEARSGLSWCCLDSVTVT